MTNRVPARRRDATISGVPDPPSLPSIQEYGDSLADVVRWGPYVRAVLARHGFREVDLQAGFVGTYPTFLAGPVVVKLFGRFPSWRSDHAAELAAQRLLREHPELPAPPLLAHGSLYEGGPDPWPYLVTGRVSGSALRDLRLSPRQRRVLAARLGQVIRRVHALPPPSSAALARDWLRDHGRDCAGRHRAWGSLPSHLVGQIDDYVVAPSPVRRLVHADLTVDHIFVDRVRLVGIIDWGDAMVTDPYYDLGALYLDAFGCDPSLLRAFLDGYGWTVGADFTRRAMSATLMHRFDLFGALPDRLHTHRFDTLDAFAAALWNV